MEDHPPSTAMVIGTLLSTAVAVALAELYSEVVGMSARLGRRFEAHRIRHVRDDVIAVAFPVIFFFLAAAGAIDLTTAFTVAKWSGFGLINFYGFCAAKLSGASVSSSLLQAAGVGALGALLIAISALVH